MNSVAVHTAIMTVVNQIVLDHAALYPLVVEVNNKATVDQVDQTSPYLKVEIRLLGGDQLDLADHPKVEQWGQIWLTAICSEGDGTLKAKALLDFITPYFELKYLGGITCRAVTSATGKAVKGLWHEPAIVNFYYHRTT
jgi:hypothetical protein